MSAMCKFLCLCALQPLLNLLSIIEIQLHVYSHFCSHDLVILYHIPSVSRESIEVDAELTAELRRAECTSEP